MENKPKIELVKETSVGGEVVYYTKINGHLAKDSLKFSEEKAREVYNMIVKHGSMNPKVEILETNSNG